MKQWIRDQIDRKEAEQNKATPVLPQEKQETHVEKEEIIHMADQPKEQATFTQSQFEQMLAMFAEMQKGNQESLLEAMRVLKEPDAYTKEKQEKQRARELEHRVNRMKDAVSEERRKRLNWFVCSHIKLAEGVMKQSHAFVSQVNNDMHFRPICCRCQRTFPKVRATDEQIRNGVSLKSIQGMTAEILLAWHRKTVPDCAECALGLCAVQQLREIKQGHLDPSPEILPDGKVLAETAIAAMV